MISLGYNFVGTTNGSSGWIASDRTGAVGTPLNPLLGPLQNNGGQTLTHAPRLGSPVIDAGQSAGLTTDQRGRVRPFDLANLPNAAGGNGSDIGACEFYPPALGIRRSGNNAVLTWPTSDTGYALESTTVLRSPPGAIIWTTVPGSPAVVGSQFVVTNGPISGHRFYRLRNP